ncbi:MAG: hypothetical protein ABIF19_14300 [Planctomycetota bacterium]
MKRRTFLQGLSAIFFGLKSSINALPSGGQFLYNGTVWQSPKTYHICIVQFLDVEGGVAKYCLLSAPYNSAEGPGTAMMVCRYGDVTQAGEFSGIYTEEELRKKLSGWKQRPEWGLRIWDAKKERPL